jgi:hypothetical protein
METLWSRVSRSLASPPDRLPLRGGCLGLGARHRAPRSARLARVRRRSGTWRPDRPKQVRSNSSKLKKEKELKKRKKRKKRGHAKYTPHLNHKKYNTSALPISYRDTRFRHFSVVTTCIRYSLSCVVSDTVYSCHDTVLVSFSAAAST